MKVKTSLAHRGNRPGRNARDHRPGRHIAGDDRAGTDQRSLADAHATQDRALEPIDTRSSIQVCSSFHSSVMGLPSAVLAARAPVVYEVDAVADEDIIADGHALADEAMEEILQRRPMTAPR